jgi:uncharacterized protein (DUF427 family)
MGLMTGTGPLSRTPAGTFNFDPPAGGSVYLEPTAKRIRVLVDDTTIADSVRASIMSETNLQPVYYFPPDDVRADVLVPSERRTHCAKKGDARYYSIELGDRLIENAAWTYPEPIAGSPGFRGLIAFYWDRVDRWFEEAEEMFVHPRDPYHRLDVLPSSRHVRISLDGELLAESRNAIALFESNLPTRWYLAREDVYAHLVPVDTVTRCGYKGAAGYYSVQLAGGGIVENLVWSYAQPFDEARRIADRLCFLNEQVDIEVDGELQARPATAWSRGIRSEE